MRWTSCLEFALLEKSLYRVLGCEVPFPARGQWDIRHTHVHSKKQASQGTHKQAMQKKKNQENLEVTDSAAYLVLELTRTPNVWHLGFLIVGNNIISISKSEAQRPTNARFVNTVDSYAAIMTEGYGDKADELVTRKLFSAYCWAGNRTSYKNSIRWQKSE